MKYFKFVALVLTAVIILSCFSGCGYEYAELNLRGEYSIHLAGTTLNVYNWGEYISDGGEDSINVELEFEKLTGINVNYTTFDSNETMYSQLKNGGVSYDIIIPSDYMIERLKNENMLKKLDFSYITNYDLIDEEYKNIYYDINNEYTVPYSIGMVGIIYNSAIVKTPVDSWSILWDEQYKDNILMFNNPRDAFAIAQFRLGQNINSTNKSDWDKAKDLLISQKPILQSYVMDEVYGKMETGEAAIAPYYAGDYLTMKEINEDLEFVYPKEGTNIFVDAICVPTSTQNFEAAMMFINFLLEPDIALANGEYIGYASPNTAVVNNPEYYYYENEILYPADENKPITQYFTDIDPDTRFYYENLWIDIKLH